MDICCAPFGTGLGEYAGCLDSLADRPILGSFIRLFVKPVRYYQVDTANMFWTAVDAAVQEVIEQTTKAKGFRQLTGERRPIMRDFLKF